MNHYLNPQLNDLSWQRTDQPLYPPHHCKSKSYDSVTLDDRACLRVMPHRARTRWVDVRGAFARTLRACSAFFALYYKQVRLGGARISIRCLAAFLCTDPPITAGHLQCSACLITRP